MEQSRWFPRRSRQALGSGLIAKTRTIAEYLSKRKVKSTANNPKYVKLVVQKYLEGHHVRSK